MIMVYCYFCTGFFYIKNENSSKITQNSYHTSNGT